MSNFDKENTYIFLDTYYSKKDQLRFLLLLKSVDLIYSINGAVQGSKVFDKALEKNIPIIMNWAGSDVSIASKDISESIENKKYIQNVTHHAVAPWLKEELKEIGINAKYLPYLHFDKKTTPKIPNSESISIITYISEKDPDFYGLPIVKKLAERHPNCSFTVVGMNGEDSNNLSYKGWVNNMDEMMNQHHVALRITKHDGLSNFILDGLSLGRTVIYNQKLEGTKTGMNLEEISSILNEIDPKNWSLSTVGIDFIRTNFNENKVYSLILKEFEKAIEQG